MGLWVEGRTINAPAVDGLDDTGLRLHVEVQLAASGLGAFDDLAGEAVHHSGAAHDRAVERIFSRCRPIEAAAGTRDFPDMRDVGGGRGRVGKDASHSYRLIETRHGLAPGLRPVHRSVADTGAGDVVRDADGFLLAIGKDEGDGSGRSN